MPRPRSRTDEQLRAAVAASRTLSEVCLSLGLRPGKYDLDEWQGEQLPLHLDHINGDHTDNRLENLRILCPNCHALTDTWCGRKRRRSPT